MKVFTISLHNFAQNSNYSVFMKLLFGSIFLSFFLLVTPVLAQQLSSAPGKRVLLRGLDKVTANTHDFEVVIGESHKFGSLTIESSYCRKRPPEEIPEIYTFLTIVDRATDGGGQEIEGRQIFNGWMFASSPALNPLEHPVYDVWVIDCR